MTEPSLKELINLSENEANHVRLTSSPDQKTWMFFLPGDDWIFIHLDEHNEPIFRLEGNGKSGQILFRHVDGPQLWAENGQMMLWSTQIANPFGTVLPNYDKQKAEKAELFLTKRRKAEAEA